MCTSLSCLNRTMFYDITYSISLYILHWLINLSNEEWCPCPRENHSMCILSIRILIRYFVLIYWSLNNKKENCQSMNNILPKWKLYLFRINDMNVIWRHSSLNKWNDQVTFRHGVLLIMLGSHWDTSLKRLCTRHAYQHSVYGFHLGFSIFNSGHVIPITRLKLYSVLKRRILLAFIPFLCGLFNSNKEE